jgi:hypothetical protein
MNGCRTPSLLTCREAGSLTIDTSLGSLLEVVFSPKPGLIALTPCVLGTIMTPALSSLGVFEMDTCSSERKRQQRFYAVLTSGSDCGTGSDPSNSVPCPVVTDSDPSSVAFCA